MASLPETTTADFVESFSRGAQGALCVTGYVILVAILLSLLSPGQRIFDAIVDGSILRAAPYAVGAIVFAGFLNGVLKTMPHRPKSYLRSGRAQLAK